MKKHKRLTAEEKEKIVDLYINTDISMNQLSKIYDVDQTTISCTLKKYNIEIVHKVGGRKRKYTVDDNYFDVIDDEHKAYWLGWLYSDGNNYIEKGVISLTVQSGDLEILEKLKCDLSSNYNIYYKKSKNENRKDAYSLSIRSKHMSKRLVELGVMGNKSLILKFPTEDQIPKHLLRHWLRGMIDGDGCIFIGEVKNKTYLRLSVCLSGTVFICQGVKDFILEEVGTTSSFYQPKSADGKTTRYLEIGGCQNAYRFLEWLYNDITVSLDRKNKKYQDCRKILLDRGWKICKTNNSRQRMIIYKGEEKNISQWAAHFNVYESLIRNRLNRGWSIEKTMETPVRGGV